MFVLHSNTYQDINHATRYLTEINIQNVLIIDEAQLQSNCKVGNFNVETDKSLIDISSVVVHL